MGKRKSVQCWLGCLKVLHGELEHSARVLLVTRTMDGAFDALDKAARSHYGTGDEPVRSDERYESHNGEVVVSPMSIRRISGQVFKALRADLVVREAEGAKASEALECVADDEKEWVDLLVAVEVLEKHVVTDSSGLCGIDREKAASRALEECLRLGKKARTKAGIGEEVVPVF